MKEIYIFVSNGDSLVQNFKNRLKNFRFFFPSSLPWTAKREIKHRLNEYDPQGTSFFETRLDKKLLLTLTVNLKKCLHIPDVVIIVTSIWRVQKICTATYRIMRCKLTIVQLISLIFHLYLQEETSPIDSGTTQFDSHEPTEFTK